MSVGGSILTRIRHDATRSDGYLYKGRSHQRGFSVPPTADRNDKGQGGWSVPRDIGDRSDDNLITSEEDCMSIKTDKARTTLKYIYIKVLGIETSLTRLLIRFKMTNIELALHRSYIGTNI